MEDCYSNLWNYSGLCFDEMESEVSYDGEWLHVDIVARYIGSRARAIDWGPL